MFSLGSLLIRSCLSEIFVIWNVIRPFSNFVDKSIFGTYYVIKVLTVALVNHGNYKSKNKICKLYHTFSPDIF